MKRIPSATLAISAVVVLAGTLAATSHTSVWVPAPPGVADPVVLLTKVAIAFGICLTIAAAWSAVLRTGARLTFAATLPGAVVAAVLLSLFLISQTDRRLELVGSEQADGPTRVGVRLESDWRGPAVRRGGREDDPGSAVVRSDLTVLLRRLVAILGVTGLAALLLTRRTAGRTAGREGAESFGRVERAAAHGVIVRTIEAMLADPDPRTAIIGAYARLLEELAAGGAPRRPYEGPSEHLVRVLRTLDARPAALKALVRLFEIARFSDHSLTAAHRSEALTALRDVAEDLTAPPVALKAETSAP